MCSQGNQTSPNGSKKSAIGSPIFPEPSCPDILAGKDDKFAKALSARDRRSARVGANERPKSPLYFNDSTKGRIRLAFNEVESAIAAPKRGEFRRIARAISLGEIFPRTYAGCFPWSP
ncbi:hypothetical protein GUITHDRAFT_100779 [Guillardia theta CCMP2712]|uniref:Uncharacterized protein n=1 Tax=Guillardia theta (strain CCMP2712) TaxID=905079 RepID=L1K062_GUITC|nr:hypothetical protein GUITHDRAFT_100779 [Guillardia theta CCMP2712]EKX53810.1 hypothetical protein GUITHDRAFT_100779 [Guillardia theta CCMP2712]|eukprot:XP_005840790.1 hypothetical protein GUITHDRAFT_100779 [Guillardia theta CCMP2712]